MDKTIYLNQLYDFYSELLTEKQKDYFERYYFDNLSLSEIAGEFEVSRNAISKQLDIIENKLNDFETKLQLLKKKGLVLDLVKNNNLLYDKINDIL